MNSLPPLGKTLMISYKDLLDIPFGTLDPIKSLFSKYLYNFNIKKIFIGKLEFKPEDDNCLAYYVIR